MSAKFKTSGITITERGPAASAKVVDVNVPKAVGDTPILLTRGRRRGPVAMATTPVSCCTATIRSESATESAIGISISTCLPARMTCSAWSACTCVGLARMTASSPA